jgi:vacuolar-type H+-ATPase subunit H
MVNYSNGKIYKIYPITGEDECYIGSTTTPLCNRYAEHKKRYNNDTIRENSKILFNKYGIENCKIELLELCPCDTKEQLHAREAYHIRNNNCVNKNIPNRTRKEYREDNKETIAKRKKTYREDNKEVIAEKRKQYRDNNKEIIAKRRKKYREANKKTISEKGKITVKCICGSEVRKDNLARHKKTKHHLQDEQEFFDGCEQALLELNNN